MGIGFYLLYRVFEIVGKIKIFLLYVVLRMKLKKIELKNVGISPTKIISQNIQSVQKRKKISIKNKINRNILI